MLLRNILVLILISTTVSATTIGINADKFTVDGQDQFLLGVSYFDSRNWHESDFQDLEDDGFNLVRIWLDWPLDSDFSKPWQEYDSYFDSQGNLIHEQELLDFVRSADDHGIIVDVTILWIGSFGGDLSLREKAVRQTVRALKDEPNVFYDIMNEHHLSGPSEWFPLDHAGVRQLISAGSMEDSDALFTVSGASHYLRDLTLQPQMIDEELAAGIDILTPHLTRTDDWYDKTDQRVTLLRDYLENKGSNIPIYLQEEQRRSFHGAMPSKDEFLQAARESARSGAAAWLFHTGAGFNMSAQPMYQIFDSVELDTVESLADHIYGGQVDLFDPLVGSTTGTRIGGVFRSGGWQTTSTNDQISWILPNHMTGPGFIEVDVSNFDPLTQCSEPKTDFLALFENSHGDNYIAGTDLSAWMYWRAGSNYISGDEAYLKVSATPGSGFYNTEQLITDVPVFNPSATYRFKIQWDLYEIWWTIDGVEIQRGPFGSDSPFWLRHVFLGRDNSVNKKSCVGPIFKNLHVATGCVDQDGDGYGAGCNEPDCNDQDNTVHQRISCSYDGNSCGLYSVCALSCPVPPAEDCTTIGDEDCDSHADCADSDCACEPSLIAHWKMDSLVENTISDDISSYYGIVNGAVMSDGIIDSALNFDGKDDYVDITNGEDLINGLDAFTISMWVRSDDTETDSGMLNTETPTGLDTGLSLRYDAQGAQGGGTNVIKAIIDVSGKYQHLESPSGVQSTSWQFVTISWSSGNPINLYLNSQLQDPTYNGDGLSGSISGASALIIGKGQKDLTTSWHGSIDDIRIYNHALSDQEILDLYNNVFHGADSNYDACIGFTELINFMNRWKQGQVTIQDLIDAISIWMTCV